MQRYATCVFIGLLAAGSSLPVVASGTDAQTQLLQDVDFCYGVSALAASTVQLRNQGQTQETQMERRKATLSEAEYALILDVSNQVYTKDLRDVFAVAGDTNAGCLAARNHESAFKKAGQQHCPRVGLMKAEVDAMRRDGKSAEETIAALKGRYAGVRSALGDSLEAMASAQPKGDVADTGAFENQMCMILAMTGQ